VDGRLVLLDVVRAGEQVSAYRTQGLVDQTGAVVIDPAAGKKTIAQGAATLVFSVASPLLDGAGGVYLKNNDIAVLDNRTRARRPDSIPADANAAMLDADGARRLCTVSGALLSDAATLARGASVGTASRARLPTALRAPR